ncbi:HNH endonuclease family protein [Cellulomonas sp. URHB0016]
MVGSPWTDDGARHGPARRTDDGAGHGPARRAATGWAVLLVGCLVVGLGAPVWSRSRAAARYPVDARDVADGAVALGTLDVRPLAPDAGYDRSRFGTAWADVDHNGCDTRNDVLRRDLTAVVVDPTTRGCVVLRGTLDDPYTGATIPFVRGPGSAAVQIDHVVALDAAWRSGARQWSATRREAFANDPANLLAVDGPANQDKGAADAAGWLPPDPGYRCVYALRQVRVKAAYGLWVTGAEQEALRGAIDGCAVAR